ncbi:hypothetical protein EC988_003657 [Linderina pennispora]|nr:hypothetical protein EC988_003657 [Linderina pennispora]
MPDSDASKATVTARPVVKDAHVLSPVKEQALKQTRRNRLRWLAFELFILLALIALLVLHSFRLTSAPNTTYKVWSKSWVMIMLSVFFVVVAFSVFVTVYYYKVTLDWIRSPETTDQDAMDPRRRREKNKIKWSVFMASAQREREERELRRVRELQRPWISSRGRAAGRPARRTSESSQTTEEREVARPAPAWRRDRRVPRHPHHPPRRHRELP